MTFSFPYKVFIGTAYSGENELLLCKEAIANQYSVDVTHYIVRHKPILEALDDLYQTWSLIKNKFDLFIQVDADVILYHNVIEDICDTIVGSKYNCVSFPVYDHFTATNIWALNCYTPTIKFPRLKNKYKPDMEFENANRLPTTLNSPAMAEHSPQPSRMQAFHFGWHRELRADVSPGQKKILRNLEKAKITDNRRHAIAGMHFARCYKAKTKDSTPIEYTNPIFMEQFKIYEESTQGLNGTVR